MKRKAKKRPKKHNWERTLMLVVLAAMIILVFMAMDTRKQQQETLEKIGVLQEWVGKLITEDARLDHLIEDLYRRQEDDSSRLQDVEEFLAPVRVEPHQVTGYAPLDPRAVAGMCHDGNPEVTASGEPPVPGFTAAAGPGTPFGTRVYVASRGWYRINDRGVPDGCIDLVVETREEAFFTVGRKTVPVLVVPP